jgi:hypothetical protein
MEVLDATASKGGDVAIMYPEADEFLTKFVFECFFASGEDEFITDVTLAVHGLLISGKPISSKRFFDRMGARLRDASGDIGLEEIGSQPQGLCHPPNTGVYRSPLSPRDLNRIRELATRHWHLENVTILGASPQRLKVDVWHP